MSNRICSVSGCGKPRHAHGYCSIHYGRWRTSGNPLGIQRERSLSNDEILDREVARATLRADGCLISTAGNHPSGYPRIRLNGRPGLLHRFILERKLGRRICPGLFALHNCHNGAEGCINEDHLYEGSAQQNADDRGAIGRTVTRQGEDHSLTRLSNDQVRDIRKSYSSGGVTQKILAAQYGVCKSTIANIVKRRTWGHVP